MRPPPAPPGAAPRKVAARSSYSAATGPAAVAAGQDDGTPPALPPGQPERPAATAGIGHLPVVAMALAALAGLMVAGGAGTLHGGQVGLREARLVPAMLGFVALLLLRDRLRGFGPAAGWVVLGAAAAAALGVVSDGFGRYGWLPGVGPTTAERDNEVVWCFTVALVAWHRAAWRWAGPLLAGCVATTRIGGYGQVLVPLVDEPGLYDAVVLALSLASGFAAGLLVVLAVGWVIFVLCRVPGRRVAPGRMLAVLAVAAGIGHMLLP
ncbi:hypothetical protein [Roseomonas sp. CECT 9278]|uniref:hypothetical protein n=1 Tax=Roseomonas sp. CECT 9278 TaxID=2845823 RepID=UPI001E3EF19E|nr:hypothetical protein [Roseomonas sp. CECT 9278]CAH0199197.1 hypothetical protein ROS9278_01878 [Roseomonas sp. CECT 9278]